MYIGVDASDQMLELSIENLKDLNNEKVFLRADF
jgi:ubiquinone/menaquinone biosynthesis C-methylase UbiE